MEDVATLSDSELRRELILHGINVGPVTPSTRSVYQKKLMRVLSGETSHDSVDEEEDNDDEHIKHNSTLFTSIQQNHDQQNHDQDYKMKSYEETSYHVSTPKHDLHHKCPSNLIIEESPYSRHYEPVDDVLRRRPFYTPSGSSVKRSVFPSQPPTIPTSASTKIHQPVQIPKSKIHKTSKSSTCCKIGVILFLVLAVLVLLVYYYMEPAVWREISTFKKYIASQ